MVFTVTELFVGGVQLPTPALEGVEIAQNKIWSSDAGRTSKGELTGRIVTIKTTVKIKWPPLTPTQYQTIVNAVSNKDTPFTTLKYTDLTGTVTTKTVYFGDVTGTQYSWSDGLRWVTGAAVDAIEK